MSIEHIKREFDRQVDSLEELNKKIALKQHTKAHIRNEIISHERNIRDLEIKLKKLVAREKNLERKGRITERDIQHLKKGVKRHLKTLDNIRKSAL